MYSALVEFVSKVRPGKFVPAKSSRIYSVHFHADMFQKLNCNRVMLKADAVPIIIKGIIARFVVPVVYLIKIDLQS